MTKTAENFVSIIPFLQFCISENNKHKETFKEILYKKELMQLPSMIDRLQQKSEFGKSRVRCQVGTIVSNNLFLITDLQNLIIKLAQTKTEENIEY